MLVPLLKLLLLSLNIRASHKALAPGRVARTRDRRPSSQEAGRVRGERARRKKVKEEVVNWIVWIAFATAERLADSSLGRFLPLYGTAKVVVLLLLLVLRGPGAQQIYDKLLSPLIRPYERPLDLAGFVVNEVLDILIALLLFLPRKAALRWKSRQTQDDIPAILRGLRQPHQPKLAESLADSIERSQGDSDAVSARFAKPIRVRMQPLPFRPTRPTTSVPAKESSGRTSRSDNAGAPIASTSRQPHDDTPPPPAASTAPFRPVPIVFPSEEARKLSSGQPRARTRSPRGPSSRENDPPHVATGGSSSIYPCLDDFSTPLSTPRLNSRKVAPELVASDASHAHTAAARSRLVSSGSRSLSGKRTASVAEASPAGLSNGTSPRSTPLKGRSSADRVGPAENDLLRAGPPPTPAPPGAFSFLSPAPVPRSPRELRLDATAGEAAEDAEMQAAETDEAEATPRRRSSRRNTATPRLSGEERAQKRKRLVSSDISGKQGSAVSTEATPARKRKSAQLDGPSLSTSGKRDATSLLSTVAGTPRQRALGAIAQLSKDMLDDEDDAPGLDTLGKRGNGVLSRSMRGQAPQAITTRRAAKKGRLPVPVRDESGGSRDDSWPSSTTVSPRKRKTASNAHEPDRPEDEEAPRPVKRVATAVNRSRTTESGKTASSRISGLPVPTAPLPSTTRLASRTASSSIATARAALARAEDPAALGLLTTRAAAATETAPKAPRRARRVLLGRAGPAGAEEEEEIDGVPVVRRRKKAL